MKVKTNLDFSTFVSVAKYIEDGFFNENGIYSPAVGKLVSMCVFFNACVDKNNYPDKYRDGVSDIKEFEEICDKNLVAEYEDAIEEDCEGTNFSSAYYAAMDAIDVRKSSILYSINAASSSIQSVIDFVNDKITPDVINRINDIGNSLEVLKEK